MLDKEMLPPPADKNTVKKLLKYPRPLPAHINS